MLFNELHFFDLILANNINGKLLLKMKTMRSIRFIQHEEILKIEDKKKNTPCLDLCFKLLTNMTSYVIFSTN